MTGGNTMSRIESKLIESVIRDSVEEVLEEVISKDDRISFRQELGRECNLSQEIAEDVVVYLEQRASEWLTKFVKDVYHTLFD
jgi:hypothetical protein